MIGVFKYAGLQIGVVVWRATPYDRSKEVSSAKTLAQGTMHMMTQAQFDELRTKLLPPGADRIIDLLARYRERVETIAIVLEKVPLLIIGRHGMIARLPQGNTQQKFSQQGEILSALQDFFLRNEPLYVFVNLPDLHVPSYISGLLKEIVEKVDRQENLRARIDEALDCGDKEAFRHYTGELQRLNNEDNVESAKKNLP